MLSTLRTTVLETRTEMHNPKIVDRLRDFRSTGGPRYMREIGTQKIGSHIINSHIKRPRITVNLRIDSRIMDISQSHINEIADKKVAYNEVCLYLQLALYHDL
jgi:hypothetical protein